MFQITEKSSLGENFGKFNLKFILKCAEKYIE